MIGRRVWLWFRSEGVKFPLQMHEHAEIRWVEASYHAIHGVLANPVYAGAYVYGKTRTETTLDASGARKKRIRHLPRDQWQVLIKEHHEGYIDWPTYEANQARIATNTRPRPHNDPSNSGGAVREGSALLQGLASCGHCGRRLRTHYTGRNSAPGYHCSGERPVNGRGSYCLNIGGVQIDEAVTHAFIAALEPAKLTATVAAAERLEADREATLKQWRLASSGRATRQAVPSGAIAQLRSGWRRLVRRLHSSYYGVRLPASVHHRLQLLAFPMRTGGLKTERSDAGSPSFRRSPFARDVFLESVRAFYVAPASLTIRRSMSLIIARMMKATWLRVRFS
jgi:hypothetical protein